MQKSLVGKALRAIILEANKEVRDEVLRTIEELHNLRQVLTETVATRLSLELKKTQTERSLDLALATITAEVIKETDENGKAKFSNETTRKAEITIRSSKDQNVQSQQDLLDKYKTRLFELKTKEDMVYADIERERTREKLYLIDLAPEQWI
jgi:hypothetical protein